MARGFLALYALLFLAFGTYAFLNPELITEMMAAESMGTDGIYELRSNYGGVSIGIGLMCLAAVLRSSLQRPALFTLMAYTGGYTNLIAYAIFEAVTALLAFTLLSRPIKGSEV